MANNVMMIGIAVVIVAVVVAGALLMSGSTGTSGNLSTPNTNSGGNAAAGTTAATTSIASGASGTNNSSTHTGTPVAPTNTTNSSSGTASMSVNASSSPTCATVGGVFTNTGGGKGQVYLSKSEISGLTFLGGQYCSAGPLNSTYMENFMGGGYVPTAFESNITAMWMMFYNNTNMGALQSTSVIEMAYQSPEATMIYANVTNELMQGYNTTSSGSISGVPVATPVLNATVNGMTYFYVNSTGYYNTTTFFGLKGDKVVSVVIYGQAVDQAPLAAAVADDLP